MMKKLFLLLLALPLVFSCGKSVEQKASELAEKSASSLSIRNFEPLSVIVEPLYNSVLFEEGVVDSLYLIATLDSLKAEFQKEYEYLYEDSITDRNIKGDNYIYSEPYRSFLYFKVGADTLGFTMDDCKQEIAYLDEGIDSISLYIMDKYNSIDKSKILGYRVIQKYSATNDIGQVYVDSLSFIMTADTVWKQTISSVAEMDSVLVLLARHIDFVKNRSIK